MSLFINHESDFSKTLYKRSKSGKIQVWTIQTLSNFHRTIEGFEGGAMTPTDWTECYATNIGRSNYRDGSSQAIFEAKSKVEKKIRKHWKEDINDVDDEKDMKEAMSAHLYKDHEKFVFSQELVASQPKLDGERMCYDNTLDNPAFTRGFKPIKCFDFAKNELDTFCKLIRDEIGISENEKFQLDGELYSDHLKDNFQDLMSIVMKQKPTQKDVELAIQNVTYNIYDIAITGLNFYERNKLINCIFDSRLEEFKYLKNVETKIVKPGIQLDLLYEQYLSEGYEGQMIRCLDSDYEHCRTKVLLKRKPVEDAEFEILNVLEGKGNRSGMMGSVVLQTEDGVIFNASAKGTHSLYRDMLNNKQKYIGCMATVSYKGKTQSGSLREPVITKIHIEC